ncbi:hypothetical protein AK88_04858 [Plasmodium fragile]|uniref:Uncharacterized protein n=1 Tax=Plasmodium fragile TaxID=5857 RepID=A0A0D9QF96_PLAFR|nr:uncharacterized protein AK88_04858 [Plasmodium fragile]KJP85507.1 hypothetical protein AK88_04858 [Plasmodium fragile]
MAEPYLSNKKIYELLSTNSYRGQEKRILRAFERRYCKLLTYLGTDNKQQEIISIKLQQFINENLSFSDSKSYFFGFSKELLVHCMRVYFYEELCSGANCGGVHPDDVEDYSSDGGDGTGGLASSAAAADERLFKHLEKNVDHIEMTKLHDVYCDEYFYLFKNVMCVLKACAVFYAYPNYKAEDLAFERNFFYVLFELVEVKLNIQQLLQIYFDTYKDTNNYFEMINKTDVENRTWVYKYIILFLNVQICCINIFFYMQIRQNVFSKYNLKSMVSIFLSSSHVDSHTVLSASDWGGITERDHSDIVTSTLLQKEYSVIFLMASVSNLLTWEEHNKLIKGVSPQSAILMKFFFLFKDEKNFKNYEENIRIVAQCLPHLYEIINKFYLMSDNFVYKRIILRVLNNALCTEKDREVDVVLPFDDDTDMGRNNNNSCSDNTDEMGGGAGAHLFSRDHKWGKSHPSDQSSKCYGGRRGKKSQVGRDDFSSASNCMTEEEEEEKEEKGEEDGKGKMRHVTFTPMSERDINFSLIKNMKKHIEKKEFFKKTINLKLFLKICICLCSKEDYILFSQDILKEGRNIHLCIQYLQEDDSQIELDLYAEKYFLYDFNYNNTEIVTTQEERKKRVSSYLSIESKNILVEISSLFFSYDYLKWYSRSARESLPQEDLPIDTTHGDKSLYHPVILHNVNRLLLEMFYGKISDSSVEHLIMFNHNLLSIYRILKALIGTSANLVSFNEVVNRVDTLSRRNDNRMVAANTTEEFMVTIMENSLYFKITETLKRKKLSPNNVFITYIEYYYILLDFYCKYIYNNFVNNRRKDFLGDQFFHTFQYITLFFCKILKINKCFHVLIEIKLNNYFGLNYDIFNSFVSLFTFLFFFSLKYKEMNGLNEEISTCLLFLLKKININKLNAYIFQIFSYLEHEDLLRRERKEGAQVKPRNMFSSSDRENTHTDENDEQEAGQQQQDHSNNSDRNPLGVNFQSENNSRDRLNYGDFANFKYEKDQMDIKENFRIDISFLKMFVLMDQVRHVHLSAPQKGSERDSRKGSTKSSEGGSDSDSDNSDRSDGSDQSERSDQNEQSDRSDMNNRSDQSDNDRSNFSHRSFRSTHEYATENFSLEEICVVTLMHLFQVEDHKANFIADLLRVYEEEKKKKIYPCTEAILKIFQKIIKRKGITYFHQDVYKSFQHKVLQMIHSVEILQRKWVTWVFTHCDNAFKREKDIDIKKLVKLFFLSFYKFLKRYFVQINTFLKNKKMYNTHNSFDDFYFFFFSKYINRIFTENFSSSFIFKLTKFSILNISISIVNYMLKMINIVNLQRLKDVHSELSNSLCPSSVTPPTLLKVPNGEHTLRREDTREEMLLHLPTEQKNQSMTFCTQNGKRHESATFNNFMKNIIINHKTLLNKRELYSTKRINIFQIGRDPRNHTNNGYTMDYLQDILLLEKENQDWNMMSSSNFFSNRVDTTGKITNSRQNGFANDGAGDLCGTHMDNLQTNVQRNYRKGQVERLLHPSTVNFSMNSSSINGNSSIQNGTYEEEIQNLSPVQRYNFTFSRFFNHIKNFLMIVLQNNYVFFLSDFLLMHYEQSDKKHNLFQYNLNKSGGFYSVFNFLINEYIENYYKDKYAHLGCRSVKTPHFRKLNEQVINRILLLFSLLLEASCQLSFLEEINSVCANISNQIFSLFDTSHLILSLFSKVTLSVIPKNDVVSQAINNDILSIEKKQAEEKREILTISLLYFLTYNYKNICNLYLSLNRFFKMNDFNNIYFLCKYSQGFLPLPKVINVFLQKILFCLNKAKDAFLDSVKLAYMKRIFHVLKFIYDFIKDNDLVTVSIFRNLFNVLLCIVKGYVKESAREKKMNEPPCEVEVASYKFYHLRVLNLALHFANAIYFNLTPVEKRTGDTPNKGDATKKEGAKGDAAAEAEGLYRKEPFWYNIDKLLDLFTWRLKKNTEKFLYSRTHHLYTKEAKKEITIYMHNLNIMCELFELIVKGIYTKENLVYRLLIRISYDPTISSIFFNINYDSVHQMINSYQDLQRKNMDSAQNIKLLLVNCRGVNVNAYGVINDDSLIDNVLDFINQRRINHKYVLNLSEHRKAVHRGEDNLFEESSHSISVRSLIQKKIELLDSDYVYNKIFNGKAKRYGKKNFLFDVRNYLYCLNVCGGGGNGVHSGASSGNAIAQEHLRQIDLFPGSRLPPGSAVRMETTGPMHDGGRRSQGALSPEGLKHAPFGGGILGDHHPTLREYKSDQMLKKKIDASIFNNLQTILPDEEKHNSAADPVGAATGRSPSESRKKCMDVKSSTNGSDALSREDKSREQSEWPFNAYCADHWIDPFFPPSDEHMERKKRKNKEKKTKQNTHIGSNDSAVNSPSSIFIYSKFFKNEVECMQYINLTQSTYDSRMRLFLILYKLVIIIKHRELLHDEVFRKEESQALKEANISGSIPFLFFVFESIITFITPSIQVNKNSLYYVLVSNILINLLTIISARSFMSEGCEVRSHVGHSEEHTSNSQPGVEKKRSNDKSSLKHSHDAFVNVNVNDEGMDYYHQGSFYMDMFVHESFISNVKNKNDHIVFDILSNMSQKEVNKYRLVGEGSTHQHPRHSNTERKKDSSKKKKKKKNENSLIYHVPLLLSLFVRCVTLHLQNFKFHHKNLYIQKNFNALHVPSSILKCIFPENHFNISLFVNLLELFYVTIRIYNNHFVGLNRSLFHVGVEGASAVGGDGVKEEAKRATSNNIQGERSMIGNENPPGSKSTHKQDDPPDGSNKEHLHLYVSTMNGILNECYQAHHENMKNKDSNVVKSNPIERMLLYFLYNRINTVYDLFYNFFLNCLREKKKKKKKIFDIANEYIYGFLKNDIYDHMNRINNFLDLTEYYDFYVNTLTFMVLNKNTCLHIIKGDILTKLLYVPDVYHAIFDKSKTFSAIYYLNHDNHYVRNKNHIILCSLIVLLIKMLYVFVKNVKGGGGGGAAGGGDRGGYFDANPFGGPDLDYLIMRRMVPPGEEAASVAAKGNVADGWGAHHGDTQDGTRGQRGGEKFVDDMHILNGRPHTERTDDHKDTQHRDQTENESEFFLDAMLDIISKLSDRINFIFLKIEKINCLAIFEESYLYVELLTKTSYYCSNFNINHMLISLMSKGVEHHLFYINRILEKFIFEKEVIIDPYSPYEITASSTSEPIDTDRRNRRKNDLSLFTQRVLYLCYKCILNYNTILLNIIQTPYFTYSYFVVHMYILLLKSTRLVTNIMEHFGRKNTTLIRTIKVHAGLSYVPICLDIVNTTKEKKREKIHYVRGTAKSSRSCYLSDSHSGSEASNNYQGEVVQYNRSVDEYINTKRVYKDDYMFNFLPEMIELKSYYNILREILERSAFLGAFILEKLKDTCEDSCLKQILISNVCSYLIHINATLLPSNICTSNLKKKCTFIYNYVVNIHKK